MGYAPVMEERCGAPLRLDVLRLGLTLRLTDEAMTFHFAVAQLTKLSDSLIVQRLSENSPEGIMTHCH